MSSRASWSSGGSGQRMLRPSGGSVEIGRQNDVDRSQVHAYRGRGFDGVGQRLEGHPAAGIAAHRPAVQAVVEVFLDVGRVEHRHQHRLEDVLGLVRQGRGFGGVVVAGDDQHAAVFRRAGGIGVAEDVAAAVDARPLAVPHAEHAVVFGAGKEADLLAAPDGGRRHVLVDAGLEGDVVVGEVLLGLPQAEIEVAERAAAVAGDEAGGVQPGGEVAFALHHRQADQRLGAGQEDAAGGGGVFVVQRRREGGRQSQVAHCRLRLRRLVGTVSTTRRRGWWRRVPLWLGVWPGLSVPAISCRD